MLTLSDAACKTWWNLQGEWNPSSHFEKKNVMDIKSTFDEICLNHVFNPIKHAIIDAGLVQRPPHLTIFLVIENNHKE